MRSSSPVAALQSLTDRSWLPDARSRPSGLCAIASTPPRCPRSVANSSPSPVSQSLTVRSLPAECDRTPVRRKRHAPGKITVLAEVRTGWPVATFHSLTARSVPVEARWCPSGLNATLMTRSECPRRVSKSIPFVASQSLIVWSELAEASMRPSGLHATPQTGARCPRNVRTSWPDAASHSLKVRIGTGRGNPAAVGAVRHIPDIVAVAAQRTDFASRGRIPYFQGHIGAGRSDGATVRAKRNSQDPRRVSRLAWPLPPAPVAASQSLTTWSMPTEATRRPSGLKATSITFEVWPRKVDALPPRDSIPDLGRSVFAGRGDTAPVRAERHSHHVVRVAYKRLDVELAQALQIVPLESASIGLLRLRRVISLEVLPHQVDLTVVPRLVAPGSAPPDRADGR